MAIDFTLTPKLEEIRLRIRTFVDEVIRPVEATIEGADGTNDGQGLTGKDRIEALIGLRKEAFQAGIWLPHMPEEWGGMGLGHVELAMVQAEAAKSYYGPWVFNCQAPDEGNMHTLLHWATDEQKEKYLRPLCEGTARSCFAMTEPEVAGSDPTLIRTFAYPDGDEWVINGHKWFTSGANQAAFTTVFCETEPDEQRHAKFSAIIVPTDTPGYHIKRVVRTMGDTLGNHCELEFKDVRVPVTNLLGERGKGFLIAQKRLGPGRIFHCMRWLGAAERCHDVAVKHAGWRTAFGKPIGRHQGVSFQLADNMMDLHHCRLAVRHAAWLLDQGEEARDETSMCKVYCSEKLSDVVDRSLQILGGMGTSDDFPVMRIYKNIRAFRLYDGPSEVHRWALSRNLLKRQG